MIAKMEIHVSENATEAMKKKLLTIISNAGPEGITTEQLTAKTRSMSRQDRRNALADLIEEGVVSSQPVKTKGNTATIYKRSMRWT